jgi:hypothetical protein
MSVSEGELCGTGTTIVDEKLCFVERADSVSIWL